MVRQQGCHENIAIVFAWHRTDSDMVKSGTGVSFHAADDTPCIVIDTNVLLDIWVYRNPATLNLLAALEIGQLRWLATAAMREELMRVLNYAHIALRREKEGLSLQAVMDAFDRLSLSANDAPRSAVVCKDPDDQKFIDLAVAHSAILLSKDKLVLKLRTRLTAFGVKTTAEWSGKA
jgi:putative PIN family toxin of toxin-antitoxin system